MFRNLSPGAIGIRGLGLAETIALARATGFEGAEISIRDAAALAGQHGVDHVRSLFAEAGVRPGSWGLPFAWQDDAAWRAGVAELPALAEVGRQLGCTRVSTWVPPGSDQRAMDENRRWHVERFGPIAEALAPSGCSIGLEFIGPKTSRDQFRHPFVYTMDGMLDLIEQIGAPNVGLLVDAWHVYTGGGSADDVARLRPEQVVVVHVNDAPAGIPIDQQDDHVRRLPLATGVIDLAGFMGALRRIGYDGPVTVEPFDGQLNDLAARDPHAAATTTAESLGGLWQVAGLDQAQ
jgi:sugar phosphate isomerase/epimerase